MKILIEKGYSVKANLIKTYPKLKALASLLNYDTSILDKYYNEIKKSIVPIDTAIENILLEMNLIIQQALLPGLFDIIKTMPGFFAVEKA
jgi:hypothetical protein